MLLLTYKHFLLTTCFLYYLSGATITIMGVCATYKQSIVQNSSLTSRKIGLSLSQILLPGRPSKKWGNHVKIMSCCATVSGLIRKPDYLLREYEFCFA